MEQPQNVKWSGTYATWDAVSGVSSYTIWLYEVDSSGTINPSHIYTNTVTATRVSLASKLEADKTYRFFVQSNASDSTHRNSASVKSNDVTTIGKIEAIGLTAPEIGRLASENAKSIKAPAGVNYTLSSAGWLDKSNNGAVLSSSAKFEADHEYTLRVYATPKTGYIFISTSKITGTVDGKAGTVLGVYDSDNQYAMRYDYGKAGKLTISSVDVSGYAVPVAGAKAGDCMNLTVSENCHLDMSKCYWYCRSTGKTLAADDVFEAGKQYALTIYVCADVNCRFAANTAVTINGSTEYVDTEHIGLGDIAIPFWAKPVTVAAAIKSVNVYGYVPAVVGEKAGDHMDLYAYGDYSIDLDSCYWYCDTDSEFLSADDVFEAGKEYSLLMYIVPNGANTFADDVEYTVNGGTEYVDFGSSQVTYDSVEIWTMPTKAKTGIQAVAITGYEPPVVGDKAGDHMNCNTIGSCSIDWSYSYWYCDTTDEYLASTDVFEAGKEYSLYLYLTSAANYLFAENAAVTVNGSKQYVDSVSTDSYRSEMEVWTLPVEAISHNYTAVVTAPTCTEKGYTTYTCTVCGDSYKSNYVNALGHQTTVKYAKPATCTADGYTGDKVCTVCGAVVEQGKTIAKLGHSYGAWKVTKAPTCTEKGIEAHYCSRCDATETREVEAAGHAYKDGVCTVCGEKDPNYVVAPDAPTLSIAKADGKIKLSWNAVDGANKYWIYRSTDGTNYKYYDTTYGTSYTNSSVTSGTKYYYKVKAVSTFSGKDYSSGYSNAKSTIPLTTPVVKASLSTGKISLSWSSVTGATKYWIYRSTDGVNFKYYDSTTKTTYTNSSVTAGTTYYYEIRAVKTVNGTDWTGSYSAPVSITR